MCSPSQPPAVGYNLACSFVHFAAPLRLQPLMLGNASNGTMSHDAASAQVTVIETGILTSTGHRWKNLRQNDLTLSSTYHYS